MKGDGSSGNEFGLSLYCGKQLRREAREVYRPTSSGRSAQRLKESA
jgi:hypothetical protein